MTKPQTESDDRLLTPREAADMLGLDSGTLQVWRSTKRYPLTYVKCGRYVRYWQSDVRAFIESRTVRPKQSDSE